MKPLSNVLIFILTSLFFVGCTTSTPVNESLVGTWVVDLRPRPSADAYFQEFMVSALSENSFEGTFYGSEITNAKVNKDWGRLYFAFTTSDDSGTYHTSGYMNETGLKGTTHSIGREFLAVWSAQKKIIK